MAVQRKTIPEPALLNERVSVRMEPLDRLVYSARAYLVNCVNGLRARYLARFLQHVKRHAAKFEDKSDAELKKCIVPLAVRLRQSAELDDRLIGETFALIQEASFRILGKRHYDVQLLGGFVLCKGMIAEMHTGEGKTLTATLPTITMALAGIPVHVITVNDYLAERDREVNLKLYDFFGVSTGLVVHGMSPDERRTAYRSDITFVTNKELTFDYLRDRVLLKQAAGPLNFKVRGLSGQGALEGLVMRGLHYAVVDEADSVLIDEARTPLILSENVDDQEEEEAYSTALDLARKMEASVHYKISQGERQITLTAIGLVWLEEQTASMSGVWVSKIEREELIRNALNALYLMERDKHYLVKDDKVQIIDESTGRIMSDRFWSGGLHQLVELKEGCKLSGMRKTIARMTYQRFFRRYKKLSGMTGTGEEVSRELYQTYNLKVARIPTHRPTQRKHLPEKITMTAQAKWKLVAQNVLEVNRTGRPVLLGTRSVAASYAASDALTELGVEHEVLNAAQDSQEADIVARAGGRNCVTVATNMAGRGTDIPVSREMSEEGGLHVVMTERHEAGRIDRQLAGRCGRQGQKGTVLGVYSLEDEIFASASMPLTKLCARVALRAGWQGLAGKCVRRTQLKTEAEHLKVRRNLFLSEEKYEKTIAFTGHGE